MSNVSLSINPGSIYVLLGPNGSGKTTLLDLLAGRLEPSQGICRRKDVDGGSLGLRLIFYFPQSPRRSLLPMSDATDNIALDLLIRGERRGERAKCAAAALNILNINETILLSKRSSSLSGGEQQLILAARLVADLHGPLERRPILALLDEPFAALDIQNRFMIALKLRENLRDAGVAAVFVSHSLDEALLLADEIILLSGKPGEIVDKIPVLLTEKRADQIFSPEATKIKRRLAEMFSVPSRKA